MTEQNQIGAIICPKCGKLISATAEKCMYCGMKNPDLWGFGGYLKTLFGGQRSFIPIIATACIVLYVISLLLDPKVIFHPQGMLGFLAPSMKSLYTLGMTGKFALSKGRWWTLITAIYLHGGILHIVFNVMWIRQLGPNVEEFYGISRSFLIFTFSGVVGFILSSQLGNQFTIGASGSIFGLLGALVYYGRKRGGTFGTAIYKQTAQWAIVLFIFGFLFPNIDNFAHAGGFIGGFLAAVIFGFNEIKQEDRVHNFLALATIGLTILAFLLSILN